MPAPHRDRDRSWIAPDAGKIALLYVSDVTTHDVYVYSYPQGKLEGTLTGFSRPWGLCVDKTGDVFVADLTGYRILKYRHAGTKPILTLNDPYEEPSGCAVDSTTGDLAVANLSTPYSSPGDVLVYPNGQGTPRRYYDKKITYYDFCGYDNAGNLYVDGMQTGKFALAKLPKGKGYFTDISVNATISYAGGVQWDGKNVAVGDYKSGVIYQFQISGTQGIEVGVTHLLSSNYAVAFWIQGSTVIGPNDDGANIMYWNYPGGGLPVKTIGGLRNPWGATISLAQ
ncbi:MAG TPA: hypothetical protein VFE35_02685 [Candidatus Cybelea sp.]|jgi:sugar lactone lactonase YvrE|nr:hypothetical protein [Candidatus Cybelea sp.]